MGNVISFERKHIGECLEIFNCNATEEKAVLKPLSVSDFEGLFLSEKYKSIGVVKENEAGAVVGFAFGVVTETFLFVSYIGVKKEYRKKGIGRELYSELEKALSKENENIKRIDCIFYNPCQLSWFIPNHHPHDHNGIPGVLMESEAYPFFKSVGFFDYAVQNAYYMPLGNYQVAEKIKIINEKLKEENITVCFYQKEKHFGFSELFDNIQNEGWRKSVMARLDEPILVVEQKGRIIGYTGPLSLSEEKRGMFCGIGVHTDFRGKGIGKALFSRLCFEHQKNGALFMSLFTGENNNARFVYEGTGFEMVGKFSCMRKNLS